MATFTLRKVFSLPHFLRRRGILVIVFASLFLVTAAYLVLIRGIGDHPSPLTAFSFHALILVCYGVLWLLLEHVFCREHPSPIQAFWHVLVGAAVYTAVHILVTLLIPGGFNEESQPVAITTVIQSVIAAPLLGAVTMLLLLRLRALILHRRSRTTVNMWRWMIGLLTLAAIASAINSVFPENRALWLFRNLTFVPLVIFWGINAFRVSWVVHLSAPRKAATIAMAIILMVICGLLATPDISVEAGTLGAGPNATTPELFLQGYNSGLHAFVLGACGFGTVYCLTAILSLVFHLPTTSDFQRRERESAAIFSLTDLALEVFDKKKLVHTITSSAAQAHSANVTWLALPDADIGMLAPQVVASHGMDAETIHTIIDIKAFCEESAATQEILSLDRALLDHRVKDLSIHEMESLLVVPIAAHRNVLGTLFLAKNVASGFHREDIRSVNAFAAQAALALDNARMFEEQVEKERMARELSIAREVQQRLLPQQLPNIPHMEVAAMNRPAQEVGGDYHDFVKIDEHRLAFIVCDVSGKGTSAAFYMAGLHGIFRSTAPVMPDPRDFLSHANRVLGVSLERSVFITAIYGIIDCHAQTITLARAGHCPGIFAVGDTKVHVLRSAGLGLGLDRGNRFADSLEVEEMSMECGDVAVLYTDGLVESRNHAGEEYDYPRLQAVVDDYRHQGAAELLETILEDVARFTGETPQDADDMTLLVFKWRKASNSLLS